MTAGYGDGARYRAGAGYGNGADASVATDTAGDGADGATSPWTRSSPQREQNRAPDGHPSPHREQDAVVAIETPLTADLPRGTS